MKHISNVFFVKASIGTLTLCTTYIHSTALMILRRSQYIQKLYMIVDFCRKIRELYQVCFVNSKTKYQQNIKEHATPFLIE